MDKLPRPGYRIEGIPAEITRGKTSRLRGATEESSTVVPFLQEDPVPAESGIDIDSQKEIQKDVAAAPASHPSETSTKETDRTLNEIKRRLLTLLGAYENPQQMQRYLEADEGDDFPYSWETVKCIAGFLKNCALAVKDFELAGIAGAVEEETEKVYELPDSNEDSSDDYEPYLEEQKIQQEARDFRSAGWFEYSHGELQTLETLGYMKDVPYGDWMSGGVPTEKATGLFKYSEDHRRIYWNKEMRKRINDEVGPGGLARLRSEAIKRKENADWEESEWVASKHLGRRLDPPLSPSLTNKALEAAGYQVKIDRGWWATEKAEGLYHQEGVRAGTARILWKKEMLDRIKEHLTSKQA